MAQNKKTVKELRDRLAELDKEREAVRLQIETEEQLLPAKIVSSLSNKWNTLLNNIESYSHYVSTSISQEVDIEVLLRFDPLKKDIHFDYFDNDYNLSDKELLKLIKKDNPKIIEDKEKLSAKVTAFFENLRKTCAKYEADEEAVFNMLEDEEVW